jgi:ferredoxin
MKLVETGARTTYAEANEKARKTALEAASKIIMTPTSRVAYRSLGRLLIIGEARQALALSAELNKTSLRCFVVAQGEGVTQAAEDTPLLFIGQTSVIRITGHLGEFTVTLVSKEHGELDVAQTLEPGNTHFDLLLDLGSPPLLGWEIPPLGYYAPQGNAEGLQRALAELPTLVGEFEKAKFFSYDADICAHGRSGLRGCTRCLDVCPTGAITSLGNAIAVDPYACQGAGTCATACPTGAITYNLPAPADTLQRLRTLLEVYRKAGGSTPAILFHDRQIGKARLTQLAERLPGQVIPFELEELGSAGMEVWLAALAYGASQVLLLDTDQVALSVVTEVNAQLHYAHTLLEGMGYLPLVLRLIGNNDNDTQLLDNLAAGPLMPPFKPAGFAARNDKRATLYYAIDFLAAQAPQLAQVIPLPPQAPFGELQIDRHACTLCMACVSVCPAAALYDGGDIPRLEFLEAHCVQCGLCEVACPEDAVIRRPRFLFDPQQRRRRRTLHEEEAFLCIACGKPFATRSIIDKMTAKLAGHRLFSDASALRRLQMCSECRVRDLFAGNDGEIL